MKESYEKEVVPLEVDRTGQVGTHPRRQILEAGMATSVGVGGAIEARNCFQGALSHDLLLTIGRQCCQFVLQVLLDLYSCQ
jgi:hypothetical protein